MKILSFIIPAYNSAAFLDKCIGSMLEPTILDKLEVLVVNDGSTDITAQIAEGYCRRFPDTVRLISQENRGHGGALNTGCAAARGKYLKAIDADDWVQTQSLPEFIRQLESREADVVLTHYRTIDITTGEVKNWRCYPEEFGRAYTLGELLRQWRQVGWSMIYHGITYRREFYQGYKEPLPEHVFYEDYLYITFPCCQARSVTCLDLSIYEYRVGDAGQSMAAANQLRRIDQLETVIREMAGRYSRLPEGDGKRYAARKAQELLLSHLTTALLSDPDKKAGRSRAKKQMTACKTATPEIWAMAEKKYWVFLLMNHLGMDKADWERIRTSRIYCWLRGQRSMK